MKLNFAKSACFFAALSLFACGRGVDSPSVSHVLSHAEGTQLSLESQVTHPQLKPLFAVLDQIFSTIRSQPLSEIQLAQLRIRTQAVLDELTHFSDKQAYEQLFRALTTAAQDAHKLISSQTERTTQVQVALLWNDILDMDSTLRFLYSRSLEKELTTLLEQRKFGELTSYAPVLKTLHFTQFVENLAPLLLPPSPQNKDKVPPSLSPDEKQLVLDFLVTSGLAQSGDYAWGALSYFLHQDFVTSPSPSKLAFQLHSSRPSSWAHKAYREWMQLPALDDRTAQEKQLDNMQQALAHVVGERTAIQMMSIVRTARYTLRSMNPAKAHEEKREDKQREDAWNMQIKADIQGALNTLKANQVDTTQAEQILLASGKGKEDSDGYFYEWKGLKLREGDVILLRGSSDWDALTNAPLRFSHFQTISFDHDGRPFIFDNSGESALGNAFDFSNFVLLRNRELTREDRKKLQESVQYYLNKGMPPYDTEFNAKDDSKMYCAELGYHLYRRANLPTSFPVMQARNARINTWMHEIGLKNPDFFITQASYALDPRFDMITSNSKTGYPTYALAHNFAIEAVVRKMSSAKRIDFTNLKDAYWQTVAWDIFRKFLPDADTRRMSSGLVRGFLNLSKGLSTATNMAEEAVQTRGITPEDDFLLYRDALREEAEAATDMEFAKVFTY